MIERCIAGIEHVAVFQQLVCLFSVPGHIKNCKAALHVLAVCNKGHLHFGDSYSGHGHNAHIGILDERLDSGALTGTAVCADVIRRCNGIHGAVSTAGQLKDYSVALAADRLKRSSNTCCRSSCGFLLLLVLALGSGLRCRL